MTQEQENDYSRYGQFYDDYRTLAHNLSAKGRAEESLRVWEALFNRATGRDPFKRYETHRGSGGYSHCFMWEIRCDPKLLEEAADNLRKGKKKAIAKNIYTYLLDEKVIEDEFLSSSKRESPLVAKLKDRCRLRIKKSLF